MTTTAVRLPSLALTTSLAIPYSLQAITLHVAPDGDDRWSGKLRRPNAERTDGPLASLSGARHAIRRLKATTELNEPVNVLVAGGEYRLTEPFVLTPSDSGTEKAPITYRAAPGSAPVFTGRRRITGLELGKNGIWQARIPEVAAGDRPVGEKGPERDISAP